MIEFLFTFRKQFTKCNTMTHHTFSCRWAKKITCTTCAGCSKKV